MLSTLTVCHILSYVFLSHLYFFLFKLQAICDTVALPDVCCTEQMSCQRHLLATVSAIIDKAGEESGIHSFTLFYVLIHVMALQPQGSLQQEVDNFRLETVSWGLFLESPGNLPGPISVFGDKCFLT